MEIASTQFYYYEIFVQYEEFAWVFEKVLETF